MKNFLVSLFAVVFGAMLIVPEAEAKRFGGGRSFGMQRDSTQLSKPATAPAPRDATSAAGRTGTAGTPPKRSWMGPLAGLAAGLGIAALLSHLGLGEEFASMVMLALLVFAGIMLLRFVLSRLAPSPRQPGYAGAGAPGMQRSALSTAAASAPGVSTGASFGDFDVAAFERQAKLNFIRLQAAADKGDIDDIRAFTTPEVYAEVAMQLRERGDHPAHTDVIELDASVLDVSEEEGRYIVSVRFSGTLREDPAAAPESISEIWHLVKPVRGSEGWRVAGIQQD